MSFRIFAAGSRKFNFIQDNCIDGDDVSMLELANKLASLEPTKMGAITTGADTALPSKGIIDLMQTMATIEFLHLLSSTVTFLAMCTGADGWIGVSARETSYVWPDTVATTKYRFYPGDNPGKEFIKKIAPVLKKTSMDNWGTIRMLAIVLAKYANHIDESARPIINIQLTK